MIGTLGDQVGAATQNKVAMIGHDSVSQAVNRKDRIEKLHAFPQPLFTVVQGPVRNTIETAEEGASDAAFDNVKHLDLVRVHACLSSLSCHGMGLG